MQPPARYYVAQCPFEQLNAEGDGYVGQSSGISEEEVGYNGKEHDEVRDIMARTILLVANAGPITNLVIYMTRCIKLQAASWVLRYLLTLLLFRVRPVLRTVRTQKTTTMTKSLKCST